MYQLKIFSRYQHENRLALLISWVTFLTNLFSTLFFSWKHFSHLQTAVRFKHFLSSWIFHFHFLLKPKMTQEKPVIHMIYVLCKTVKRSLNKRFSKMLLEERELFSAPSWWFHVISTHAYHLHRFLTSLLNAQHRNGWHEMTRNDDRF